MTASAGNDDVNADAVGLGRRVLIIVENLPVPFDRRVWQEATTLRNAGYEVSIICPTGVGFERRREDLDGVHIYRHPLPLDASGVFGYLLEYGVALFFQTLLAWRIFFTHGFDAIHACNPPDNIFLVAAPFKVLFGRRFLFDHHDISPELWEAKKQKRGPFHSLLLRFERWTFGMADVSIATNESYRRIAIERGGMDPDDTFVVRSGSDLSRFPMQPPTPELKQGRRYLIAYVGVMGEQEGIPYLLDAAKRIVEHHGRDDVHFTLMGGGPVLDEMRARAREMGLDHVLNFPGRVPDDVMLATLNTADVCVNPDEYNAMNDLSTMNKILEYMAVAKPVVQFDLTEGRVSAGEASLYAERNNSADLADKIVELLDDPERRERMGQIGRQRMEQELSWQYQRPRLLAAYDQLFASKRRASVASAPSTESRGVTKQVLWVTPGGLAERGGIGQVSRVVNDAVAGNADAPRIRVIDPRGTGGRWWSLVRLPLALLRVASGSLRRGTVIHVHIAARGSTLRKLSFVPVALLTRTPLILHLHAGAYPAWYRSLSRPLRWVIGAGFRRASMVVALSPSWKDFIVNDLGVDPDRVTILENAVFGPDDSTPTRIAGPCQLLFLGKINRAKGVYELINALGSPQMRALDWTAVIAGEGEIEECQQLARDLGIADRISFPGWVDQAEVKRLLGSSKALVLPSHFEALPMSVLEAAAHELAIVCTPVGALPEVLTDQESALFVPIEDVPALSNALSSIVEDVEFRAELATNAKDVWRARFNASAYVERLSELYQRIAS